jgi:hypothetical protein
MQVMFLAPTNMIMMPVISGQGLHQLHYCKRYCHAPLFLNGLSLLYASIPGYKVYVGADVKSSDE